MWSHEDETIPLSQSHEEEPENALNAPLFTELLAKMENADLLEQSALFDGEQAIANEPDQSSATTGIFTEEDWDIDATLVLPRAEDDEDDWADARNFYGKKRSTSIKPQEFLMTAP